MGWAYGQNSEGRNVGYGVPATCDLKHCRNKIDRGLGFVCGGMHDGGQWGCGGYFCSKHLFMGPSGVGQLCEACTDSIAALLCQCGHTMGDHADYHGVGNPAGCENVTDGEECLCDAFDLVSEFVQREAPKWKRLRQSQHG